MDTIPFTTRLDRSDRRVHVQRKERRADPEPPARSDRRLKVQAFKPADRHPLGGAQERRDRLPRRPPHPIVTVAEVEEIEKLVEQDTAVVGIDEAQFFDSSLVDLAQTLAADGRRVIVAGLDLDYRGRPFEPMPL